MMADSILHFQDGREAAMRGEKRDARRNRDWLEGFDQVTAQGGEARRATTGTGVVHEHPVAESHAPKGDHHD